MFVSSSTGSVQESLYNHFKEAIPIKPSAEFLQKIAVSIAFTLLIRTTEVDLGKGAPTRPPSLPPFPPPPLTVMTNGFFMSLVSCSKICLRPPVSYGRPKWCTPLLRRILDLSRHPV